MKLAKANLTNEGRAGILRRPLLARLALLSVLTLAASAQTQAATLQVEITPKFAGEPIQPASLRYETAAGETFSITRLSYLVSDCALLRDDGSWLEVTNALGWLDAGQNRNSFQLENLPTEEFHALRFAIGLNTNLNHADPAQFSAEHPLNPNLDGLHWSWQGGYIFMAVEGLWRNAAGELDGWSYHLARDTNATRIFVPLSLTITNRAAIGIDFDLATLLKGPRPLSFARDGSSTHSRDGDPVAAALTANLPSAFRVRHTSYLSEAEIAATRLKPLYLPPSYTPYEFKLSASFPLPDLPRDNPLIVERVRLGEKLFHERALSSDGTISCASCHHESAAFSDPRRFSLGVRDQVGVRHAMPLFNLAWKSTFFWDGRAPSLRAQTLMPMQDHAEMDDTLTNIVAKLSANTNYTAPFTAAFGSPEITAEKVSLALEQFVLTLTSYDSKFDHVMRGVQKFTPVEQRGFELFSSEYDPRRGQYGADCFHCHGGPLFQSQTFANNGLDAEFKDAGRAKVTGKDSDRGKFAVPSLRNVELTGPYMHDGRFKTLEEAVEHYATGIQRSATLDPNIAKHPDGGVPLSADDKAALVAFLKTLTDEHFREQAGDSVATTR